MRVPRRIGRGSRTLPDRRPRMLRSWPKWASKAARAVGDRHEQPSGRRRCWSDADRGRPVLAGSPARYCSNSACVLRLGEQGGDRFPARRERHRNPRAFGRQRGTSGRARTGCNGRRRGFGPRLATAGCGAAPGVGARLAAGASGAMGAAGSRPSSRRPAAARRRRATAGGSGATGAGGLGPRAAAGCGAPALGATAGGSCATGAGGLGPRLATADCGAAPGTGLTAGSSCTTMKANADADALRAIMPIFVAHGIQVTPSRPNDSPPTRAAVTISPASSAGRRRGRTADAAGGAMRGRGPGAAASGRMTAGVTATGSAVPSVSISAASATSAAVAPPCDGARSAT